MKYIQGIFIIFSLFFTACEDKGYGTQDISKVSIPSSTDSLTIIQSVPKSLIAQRSYINIEFSKFFNQESITDSTVSLIDSNGSVISIELSYLDSSLYILPTTSLVPTHTYTLSISSAVSDLIGNSLDKNYAFTYTCKSDFWQSTQAGYTHSMALSKDGDIYLWGSATSKELDGISAINRIAPLPLDKLHDPYAYSAGNSSSGFITQDKVLSIIGRNQLVDNTSSNFDKISLGGTHSAIIKDNGTLFSWGSNANGQLGNLGIFDKDTLSQESTLSSSWSEVSAGYNYTIALRTDGTMWGWGYNEYGQIGNSELNERRSPQQEDTNATDWSFISAGTNHSVAIKTDGTLWSWGLNASGELGKGDTNSSRIAVQESSKSADWVSVSIGNNHTLALKTDGTLWAWGSNFYGQLGLGDTTDRTSPTQITAIPGKITSMSAGRYFSLATDEDGKLWAWGRNEFSQLGISDSNATDGKLSPVEVK